jgi:Zn-dependent protease
MLGISFAQLVARIIVLVVAFTAHELAHAWTAEFFGDDTPRMNGRLTLNPLAHLDPIGSLLLLVAGFGWAKPVPINPYVLNRRSPLAVMWVSLAGPMSNFLMAILGAIPLRFNWVHFTGLTQTGFPTLYELLYYFVFINLILMLFNLIPIAPLDGSKIAVSVLPESWGRAVEQFSSYGPIVLLVLVFVGPMVGFDVLGWIMNPVMNNLMRLLIGV